jgi:secreted trypsin-like serine protease
MASGQPDYTRAVAVTVIDTPDTINVEVANTSPPLNVTFPSTQDVNVLSMPASTTVAVASVPSNLTTVPSKPFILGRTATFEDASFVTGDSPATHDVNAALGRNAHDGYLVNDGAGNLTYQISNDGTNYGGAHTLKKDETVKLTGLDISKIKITWSADTAYRIMVI